MFVYENSSSSLIQKNDTQKDLTTVKLQTLQENDHSTLRPFHLRALFHHILNTYGSAVDFQDQFDEKYAGSRALWYKKNQSARDNMTWKTGVISAQTCDTRRKASDRALMTKAYPSHTLTRYHFKSSELNTKKRYVTC